MDTKPDPCCDKIAQSSGRHSGRQLCPALFLPVGDKVGDKVKTKPDPCRDKIAQSSGRHSGRQSGRQSQIHVVTRSHRAVGETLGEKVGDKVGDKLGHKVGDQVGDKARSMS